MPDRIRVFSILAVCLVSPARCLAQAAAPTQQGVIHVGVVGLRNNNGQVFCALYASAEGFPKDSRKATRRDISSLSDKIASCEFLGIEPGTYAVSVFHDENSNGKLDTNFLGIPREGVGASFAALLLILADLMETNGTDGSICAKELYRVLEQSLLAVHRLYGIVGQLPFEVQLRRAF